ncbi:MAG: helix-turn-helix transcriptional regulator [Bacteroidaceae bacterium]|nr:helix-turn-helix transcriptional regulator [Bacteroidaceae bacterium]
MEQISNYVKRCRKEQHLTQPELAQKAGVGLRFLRELEQGKQSLRMDKVNQVLAYFGSSCGVNQDITAKQDITKYRLSSLDEPSDYMLEEIMHQVCESAMESYSQAQKVLRNKLEEIRTTK